MTTKLDGILVSLVYLVLTFSPSSPEVEISTYIIPSVRVLPSAEQIKTKEKRVEQWLSRYRAYGLNADMADLILDKAEQYKIPPHIAFGLVKAESEFYARAKSWAGARGLAQVMLATARTQRPDITAERLYDPETNLDIGFAHLRFLLRYYDGNVRLALLGYNRGHGTVDAVLARGGDPSNGYVRKVLGE